MSRNGKAYTQFLEKKHKWADSTGFDPLWIPDWLFPFQKFLVEWSIRKGRSAIFADCGLGKSPMQLVWADNVVRKTNGNVLILTPLAVSHQILKEADKFDIEARRSVDGKNVRSGVTVTNYERLHYFDPDDFVGVVCDESSILKNFKGARKTQITEFVRERPYRLLCTATAAPNDFDELGTSSEALGYLGYQDMLSKFFKSQTGKDHMGWGRLKFILRRHAEVHFWRWVGSWSRPMRRPSDYGFDDDGFILPELVVEQTVVDVSRPQPGTFFPVPAVSLQDQREELRETLDERCDRAAGLADHDDYCVLWCHLNAEGDRLEAIIPGCEQVSGKDSDEAKEEKLVAFTEGQIKKLVTKPRIAGFGLNWQHCNHMTCFPSHSFEQFYQSVRRLLRFGQNRPVRVDVITTIGEKRVLSNLLDKQEKADYMFDQLIRHVNESLEVKISRDFGSKEVPQWMM